MPEKNPLIEKFKKSVVAAAVGNALVSNVVEAAFVFVDDDCSLAEAIVSANTDSTPIGSTCESGDPGLDVINVPEQTISLSNPLSGDNVYLIDSEITIQSPSNFQINGASNSRAFFVSSAGNLTISNATIVGSSLSSSTSTLKNGAAIYSAGGNVALNSVTIANSQVTASELIDAKGGAIYMKGGDLTLDRTLIFGNQAGSGGGIALANDASLSATESYLARNYARFSGAGIFAQDATNSLELTDSNLTENTAVGTGGGIQSSASNVTINGGFFLSNRSFFGAAGIEASDGRVNLTGVNFRSNFSEANGATIKITDEAELTVKASSFQKNGKLLSSSATVRGGAIYINNDGASEISHTIQNSTLTSNKASEGGSIFIESSQAVNTLNITNSTIIADTADGFSAYALAVGSNSEVVLENSIVSFNDTLLSLNPAPMRINTLCTVAPAGSISAQSSLLADGSCGGVNTGNPMLNKIGYDGVETTLSVGGNDWYAFPRIWNLRLFNTRYHTPLFNSPALDAGNLAICSSGSIDTDQRGVSRLNNRCDIGAIEAEQSTIVVDEHCNLDTAIQSINQRENTSNQYSCEDGRDLNTVTFVPTMNNGGFYDQVLGYNSSLRRSAIIVGPGKERQKIVGGAIQVEAGGWLKISGVTGQGIIVNSGYAHLDSVLQQWTVRAENGVVRLEDSTITDSSGNFVSGLSLTNSESLIERSTISNNTQTASGSRPAGIFIEQGSEVVIANSTISENSSSGTGGGIMVENSRLRVIHSTIADNHTDNIGGGVYVRNTLTSNQADTTEISVFNSLIIGNTANSDGNQVSVKQFGSKPIDSDFRGGIIGDSSETYIEAVDDPFSLFNFGDGQKFLTSLLSNGSANPDSTPKTQVIKSLTQGLGKTETHFLVKDSPAVNSGLNLFCKRQLYNANLFIDQTGLPREDSICDVGSVEHRENDSSCYVVKAKNGKVVTFCF